MTPKKERESGDLAKQRLRSCKNENQELSGRIDLLEVSFSVSIPIPSFFGEHQPLLQPCTSIYLLLSTHQEANQGIGPQTCC